VTVQRPAFSDTHNSVTETVSSQSAPVERREVLTPKKPRTSVNTGIFFALFFIALN
jgi:hypothetical protein